jgi:hypothetical protein
MGICCSKVKNLRSKTTYKVGDENEKMMIPTYDVALDRASKLNKHAIDQDFDEADTDSDESDYDPTKDEDAGDGIAWTTNHTGVVDSVPQHGQDANPTNPIPQGTSSESSTIPESTAIVQPPPAKLISFNGSVPFNTKKRWSMLLEKATDGPPVASSAKRTPAIVNNSTDSPGIVTHISKDAGNVVLRKDGGSVLYKQAVLKNAAKAPPDKPANGVPKPHQAVPLSDIPFMKVKSNSTSSVFVSSTINSPDIDELCRTMSLALFYLIQKHYSESHQPDHKFEIFDETRHPLTKAKINPKELPSVLMIYKFVNAIFTAEKLAAECLIMCLAYVERLIALSGLVLTPYNWRRVVLGALILASKVWEEQAVWNADFLELFPAITVNDLNLLERHYLHLLQFNVTLSASFYAKYYFELRSLSEKDRRQFPLDPLNNEAEKRLEQRSAEKENKARKIKRSQSMEFMVNKKKSFPQVLN